MDRPPSNIEKHNAKSAKISLRASSAALPRVFRSQMRPLVSPMIMAPQRLFQTLNNLKLSISRHHRRKLVPCSKIAGIILPHRSKRWARYWDKRLSLLRKIWSRVGRKITRARLASLLRGLCINLWLDCPTSANWQTSIQLKSCAVISSSLTLVAAVRAQMRKSMASSQISPKKPSQQRTRRIHLVRREVMWVRKSCRTSERIWVRCSFSRKWLVLERKTDHRLYLLPMGTKEAKERATLQTLSSEWDAPMVSVRTCQTRARWKWICRRATISRS